MSLAVTLIQLGETIWPKPARHYHTGALDDATLREVEARVRPILDELETLRRRSIQQIDFRAAWMIPVGAVGAFVAGYVFEDRSTITALVWGFFGGFIGWGLAYAGPATTYRRAYKAGIIPHLTACFGELNYRPAEEPDLKRLAKLGLIPGFGKRKVEDEIYGTYRGVAVNIVEASLETGGKNSSVVFNGLLTELAFPGRFPGITVVAKDSGVLGNALKDFVRSSGLERVRLEDPRFEDRYQVYSSDQIAARALLTPAVMERLMVLDRQTEGDPPRLLAEHGTLRMALSKGKGEDLFEPPGIADPAHGGQGLVQLSSEISSVLKLVDAVLDLAPAQTASKALADPVRSAQ
jgi:hypothetical protein